MCQQGYLILANLLIRRQLTRVKKRWTFFKNRGPPCKHSLSLLLQLSRGQFAENRLGALLYTGTLNTPAGIFCRLQVAGCRLKFHYNCKTAGTKK